MPRGAPPDRVEPADAIVRSDAGALGEVEAVDLSLRVGVPKALLHLGEVLHFDHIV